MTRQRRNRGKLQGFQGLQAPQNTDRCFSSFSLRNPPPNPHHKLPQLFLYRRFQASQTNASPNTFTRPSTGSCAILRNLISPLNPLGQTLFYRCHGSSLGHNPFFLISADAANNFTLSPSSGPGDGSYCL